MSARPDMVVDRHPYPVVVSGRPHALPADVWPRKLREGLADAVRAYLLATGEDEATADRAAELAVAGQVPQGASVVTMTRDQLAFYAGLAGREADQ